MKRFATIIVLSTTLAAGPALADHDEKQLLSKENVGGAIGATVGGFLGSKVGDGKGRLATTAAGAVGGFLLGENIAHNYRGSRKQYSSHRSHRSKHRRGHRARLRPINKTFVAKTTSNVRAGPGTRFAITDRLYDHERVHVVGKVKGRRWFMVRSGGRRGFVYAPLLRPYRHHGYGGHTRYDRDNRDGGPRAGW